MTLASSNLPPILDSRRRPRLAEFGRFQLDLDTGELLRDGNILPLQKQPFVILSLLLSRPGQVVSRSELFLRLWPSGVFVDHDHGLNRAIRKLRVALGDTAENPKYIETLEGRGYRFIGSAHRVELGLDDRSAIPLGLDHLGAAPLHLPDTKPPFAFDGGALPHDSPYYVQRTADEDVGKALSRQASIVLVHGPRQVGKSSLLARALHRARGLTDTEVILIDLQKLDSSQFESSESFLRALANCVSDQLQESPVELLWDHHLGATMNFDRFLRRVLADEITRHLVLAIDEVDRLLHCPFATSIFGLIRSWHNARALDPRMPWWRLTIVMAYSSEEQLFIADVNQSPFNVGTRATLADFASREVEELNQRFNSPLKKPSEVIRFYELLCGQPYLSLRGLHLLSSGQWHTDDFFSRIDGDEGPYSDALRALRLTIERYPEIAESVRHILRGGVPNIELFYQLRSWGLLVGSNGQKNPFRCPLYQRYLAKHFH